MDRYEADREAVDARTGGQTALGPPGVDSPAIKLAGAFNFRDLGGLPAGERRQVRRGLLYRSDTLQALTSHDVHRLVEVAQLDLVVDLRRGGEVVSEGRGALANTLVNYLNVPLAELEPSDVPPRDQCLQFYLHHLGSTTSSLPTLVRLLSAAAGKPLLVHCAAGKDRTGLVIALLLALLGVDRDHIVADYVATQANMQRIVERFRRWPHYRAHMASVPPEVYEAREHTILGFLEALDQTFGGAVAWASARGVAVTDIERLRKMLLERSGRQAAAVSS